MRMRLEELHKILFISHTRRLTIARAVIRESFATLGLVLRENASKANTQGTEMSSHRKHRVEPAPRTPIACALLLIVLTTNAKYFLSSTRCASGQT